MGIQLQDYNIKYELPFLRAIYNTVIPAENESKAIELFGLLQPNGIVRKISTKNADI